MSIVFSMGTMQLARQQLRGMEAQTPRMRSLPLMSKGAHTPRMQRLADEWRKQVRLKLVTGQDL